MKPFSKKILLFLLPVFLYAVIILWVDPYNYLNNTLIEGQLKRSIAQKLNYPLYSLLEFKRKPTPGIILGDSRSANLPVEVFHKYSDSKFTNLAYGGGTLAEVIKTFWELSTEKRLKKVYIGINFNLYNQINNMDRVSEAIEIRNNLIRYIFNQYTFRATTLILKKKLFNASVDIGKPPLSGDAFWKHQLKVVATGFYKKYSYPKTYYTELKKIAKYCATHNIKLVFFIPPTHTDLQNVIKKFNLEAAAKKFKQDLRLLGNLYDFDFPSKFTSNKENFLDPFHSKYELSDIIVSDIMSKSPKNAKYYSH